MMRTKTCTATALVAAICTVGMCIAAEGELPLGHPDFYPSPTRPIGWRGDWSGAWPGADCVGTWNTETGENVVWKTPTPGAGFAQPVVAGEKVFTTADPNLLVCVDVHTGKILWQTAIDHTTAMDEATREKARAEIAFFDALAVDYYQWRRDIETLIEKIGEKGVKLGKKVSIVDKRLRLAVPKGAEDVFAQEEIKTVWDKLLAKAEETGWDLGKNEVLPERSPLSGRFSEANRLYDIWWGGRYDGLTTWSFATPCTDGEGVYVTTVNNAVAAVNYDGSIQWIIWESRATDLKAYGGSLGRKKPPMGTRYVPSPVLYGNTLVVNQNNELRAYDKRTGKKLWGHINTVEALGIKKQGPGRQWPEGSSPLVVEAPLPDGGVLPLVFEGSYFFYRLDDGKLLSTNGYYGACSSPVVKGNTVAKNNESTFMLRVTAPDRDTVRLDPIYAVPKPPKGVRLPKDTVQAAGVITSILHDGWWYASVSKRGVLRFSMEDASHEVLGRGFFGGHSSPIIAGNRLYDFASGQGYAERSITPHSAVKGVNSAAVLHLETKQTTRLENAVIDRRMTEDEEFARRTVYARMGEAIFTGSPSAQANRLFLRSKGYLWCIGNPEEPFPVSETWPAQGRVTKRNELNHGGTETRR